MRLAAEWNDDGSPMPHFGSSGTAAKPPNEPPVGGIAKFHSANTKSSQQPMRQIRLLVFRSVALDNLCQSFDNRTIQLRSARHCICPSIHSCLP